MALVISPVLPPRSPCDPAGPGRRQRWSFRKTWDIGAVTDAAGGGVGVFLGWALAAMVSVSAVELAIGVISIAFACSGCGRNGREGRRAIEARPARPWLGALCGVVAGFHQPGRPRRRSAVPDLCAAPPPAARRVHRHQAHLLAATNWMKVPAYAPGPVHPPDPDHSAVLLPWPGLDLGRGWLVRRVPAEGFYKVIYLLLIAVGGNWPGTGPTACSAEPLAATLGPSGATMIAVYMSSIARYSGRAMTTTTSNLPVQTPVTLRRRCPQRCQGTTIRRPAPVRRPGGAPGRPGLRLRAAASCWA